MVGRAIRSRSRCRRPPVFPPRVDCRSAVAAGVAVSCRDRAASSRFGSWTRPAPFERTICSSRARLKTGTGRAHPGGAGPVGTPPRATSCFTLWCPVLICTGLTHARRGPGDWVQRERLSWRARRPPCLTAPQSCVRRMLSGHSRESKVQAETRGDGRRQATERLRLSGPHWGCDGRCRPLADAPQRPIRWQRRDGRSCRAVCRRAGGP